MKKVLLAEDHAPTREHLSAQLAQAGYLVRAAADPGSAMELFASDRPDIVLVAVELPLLNGAHVGKLIRASDIGSRAVLVAIDRGHLGKAKGVGAILDLKVNAYVVDPMKTAELLSKLESLRGLFRSAPAHSVGSQATLGRPPVASGDMRKQELPPLLHSCHRLRRDGILVVAVREVTRRVFLLGGAPVGYDSTSAQDSFPAQLSEKEELSKGQAEAIAKALAAGARLPEALFQAGLSFGAEELRARLRDYTREKVAQVVGMREGRYALYAGSEFAKDLQATEVPALAPILEGARRSFPLTVYAQALKEHRPEFPYRTADFGRDLPALGLGTSDLKIAMQVNGRIALSELLAHGRGDLRGSYSLLWFLSLIGDVAFSKIPVAAGEGEALASEDHISPRKKKPLPSELVSELREAAVRIITSSYFRVLGLDITADTEAVERAYHQVATKFHPDSYPEHDTSEIKDLLESLQDKLSASYRVLAAEEKRRAYLQYLLSRQGSRRVQPVSVDAEIALRRGAAALLRKDPRSALAAFEQAVSLHPKEPVYCCYLAFATYLSERGTPKERSKQPLKLIKKALALDAESERAAVISAILENESGDAASARKRLLKALEQNPQSHLAKAALRRVGR
ncbi:MAG: response regulator [Myxococcales bacterium]|nr:response regulator [Myxococcales bacterium]